MTQPDLFSADPIDAPPTAPETYAPLCPETWEPTAEEIRQRLQEHAYYCERMKIRPLDLARDCDFLLQLLGKEADPTSIATTAAHWFEKYKSEAGKRGECVIARDKALEERDAACERVDEAIRTINRSEELAAALLGLVDAVNTMTYPRHHPAYGVALRAIKEMKRPYPSGRAVAPLLHAVSAALPHLKAATELLEAARPGEGEFAAVAIKECEDAIRFAETGSFYEEAA